MSLFTDLNKLFFTCDEIVSACLNKKIIVDFVWIELIEEETDFIHDAGEGWWEHDSNKAINGCAGKSRQNSTITRPLSHRIRHSIVDHSAFKIGLLLNLEHGVRLLCGDCWSGAGEHWRARLLLYDLARLVAYSDFRFTKQDIAGQARGLDL